MSVAELSNTDRFEKEYPSSLAARLHWLGDRLGIGRSQILRLMGLSDVEVVKFGKRPWQAIAREYDLQATQVEHLLTHYLSYFDYDAKKARVFPDEFAAKVGQGVYRLTDYIPGFASAKTRVQKQEALLAAIYQDDSGLLPAMACFLASPARNGRR